MSDCKNNACLTVEEAETICAGIKAEINRQASQKNLALSLAKNYIREHPGAELPDKIADELMDAMNAIKAQQDRLLKLSTAIDRAKANIKIQDDLTVSTAEMKLRMLEAKQVSLSSIVHAQATCPDPLREELINTTTEMNAIKTALKSVKNTFISCGGTVCGQPSEEDDEEQEMTEKEKFYMTRGTRYLAVVYDEETGAIEDSAEFDNPEDAKGCVMGHGWDAVIDQVTGETVWSK